MSRQRKRVEAYDPEFLLSLKKAATEGLEVVVGPRNLAISMRHRLYSLRKAMADQNHPDYPLVARVVLSVYSDPTRGWILIGSPGDDKLAEILRNQGGDDLPPPPDLEL
jgi:hypothetical protein